MIPRPVQNGKLKSNTEPAITLRAKLIGVGTATPPDSYTQLELLERFQVRDRRLRSIFLNGGIKHRHLILPERDANGCPKEETQAELLEKHRRWSIELGRSAIQSCFESIGAAISDIAYICCVTTTGFLSPGVSARLCMELGIKNNCARLDVVGMGCNAGLNGLNAAAAWCLANPDKLAILVCVEVCSACYVFDETMRTTVVNSLFGDGAAAVAVMAARDTDGRYSGPAVTRFQSRIITEALGAMRYDWDELHGKFSFFLDPDIPFVIGAAIEEVVDCLLSAAGIRRSDIAHWLVHSGGKKVIDAIKVNLGLCAHDLRHTTGVLRDYGNLSSGSFLFSYQRLVHEDAVRPGENGVMITMGPGSTIECALLKW